MLHASVQRCLLFLKQYRSIAEEVTPHIYLSALPFAGPSLDEDEDPFRRLITVSASVKPDTVGRVLYGHEGATTSAAFSPDSKRLVSGSYDHTVRLWDVQSGTQIGPPLNGHKSLVTSVIFSYNGQLVSSGSRDHTVLLWDAETGKMVGQPMKEPSEVNAVIFSPGDQYIVSGSSDGGVRVWDVQTHTESGQSMLGHSDSVNTVAFSPDGLKIVSASDDGTAIIWDLSTRQQIRRYSISIEEDIAITSASFSSNGEYIIAGSRNAAQNLFLWDLASGVESELPFEGSSDFLVAAVIAPDCRRVYSLSEEGRIWVWDIETRVSTGNWLEHEGVIRSFAISSDGQHAVCMFQDGTMRIRDLCSSVSQVNIPAIAAASVHHTGFLFAVFSADDKKAVSGSEYGQLVLWDVETGLAMGETAIDHLVRGFRSLSFSSDGRRIISTSYDFHIRVWDAEAGKNLSMLIEWYSPGVTSASFSPDNTLIVSTSMDGPVHIWDAQTYTPVRYPLIDRYRSSVITGSFSPNGKQILSGCRDGTLLLWDVKTGFERRLEGVEAWVSSAPWSPDGQSFVGVSGDNKLYIWQLVNDEVVEKTLYHSRSTNRFYLPSFSPDGKLIVSSKDSQFGSKTVSLWDLEVTREVVSFSGHQQNVKSVTFSHDGSLIMSASSEAIRLWRSDISTGIKATNEINASVFFLWLFDIST